jgi:hypothetical protein
VDSFGAPVTHGFKGHLPGVDAGGQRSLMMGALEKLRFVNEGTGRGHRLGCRQGTRRGPHFKCAVDTSSFHHFCGKSKGPWRGQLSKTFRINFCPGPQQKVPQADADPVHTDPGTQEMD